MKKFKQVICTILAFAIVITGTLICPLSASATAPTPVALSTLSAGDTVRFGGETWIVLNPSTGYLLMQGYYSTNVSYEKNYFLFDSTRSTSYDPTSSTNIAYTLNNDFYNSLGSDSALVQSKTWYIGPKDNEYSATVTCKIGMIRMSEAATYQEILALNILGSSSDYWWTLTPNFDATLVDTRAADGVEGGFIDSDDGQTMVRPALYLSPSVLVSGGDGGTVLGGIHNIPVITGVSPAEGPTEGGTEVIVTGTGMNDTTYIYFGDTLGTIRYANDTAVTAISPPGSAGIVDITLMSLWGPSETSSDDEFQYKLIQAAPTFSPAGGAVDFGTELQIISDGAEHIYYTTDGTDPDTSSTEYDDTARPVIDSAMTVKAIAAATGKENSAIASASYTQAESADLTDLVVSGSPGNFTFASDQYTYDDVTVASDVESVTVTPTGSGTITVNGTEVASDTASDAIALTAGVEKTITVVATETGKPSKTYTIYITRAQFAASITKNGITTNYDTLSAALAAADNDTITLLKDITETVSYTASTDHTITIDGKGYTITGEAYTGGVTAALTLSGDGNVILKDLKLVGGKANTSYGLFVSGSVNVLCEGTVNASGASDDTASSSTYSIGLMHTGSGSVNIINAIGDWAYESIGVENTGTGTVNVNTAHTYGSGSKYSGISYGVLNTGAGTVNVTTAAGGTSKESYGVANYAAGTVNVINAVGGKADYISFGVCGSDGPINVTNPITTAGATYSSAINGGSNVHTGENITTLTLNRGSGESCVLDVITVAKYVNTTIGILPGVIKDGVVYSWYSDSAKTNLFNTTTLEATESGVTVTNLYSGLSVSDNEIDISAISGVTAPGTGEAPVSSIADTAEYTAAISWSPAASTFAADTEYTATITLTPKTGYTLTGVAENYFTVAGATATNEADSGVVTAVFPATAVASSGGSISSDSSSDSSNSSDITISTTGSVTTGTASITGSISDGAQIVAVPGSTMTSLTNAAKTAENAGNTAVAEINTGSNSGLTHVGVTIPGTQFDAFASGTSASLQFSTGLGTVTFSSSAVDTINAAGSGEVVFSAGKVDPSTLSADEQSAVGDRPVYSFSVTVGGTTVSEFGSSVTVSVPYTLQDGEDPNAIVVYYVDASGNLQTVKGAYDAATGKVTFVTTHFSAYVIGYNKVTFNDVTDTDWYADAVTFIAARGITGGTTSTTFSPNATLTRGQFITMLLRAYGISPDTSLTDNFADAGDTYYTGYLATAKELGISSGVGDNKFAPEQSITRQEMFTMLYNALKALDELPSGDSGETLSDFSDTGDIAAWATDAMTLFVETGTVSGNSDKLSPTDTTTRAEMAQVLYNLLTE